MNKRDVLDQLIDALADLVALLALDPKCPWRKTFASNLELARRMKGGPLGADELAALSASIRHVYGGMGSFNDYAPVIYDAATRRHAVIPGMDGLNKITSQVFSLAVDLITVEPA